MPDLQFNAHVSIDRLGRVSATLSRPGFAVHTDPANPLPGRDTLKAWARRWPEHFESALHQFEQALRQGREGTAA